jgi:hypothetical protein
MIPHILYQLWPTSLSSSAKSQFSQFTSGEYPPTVFLKWVRSPFALAITLIIYFILLTSAQALTLTVIDSKGKPVNKYRWLIEEDVNYHVEPGTDDPNPLRFHRSYMPVVTKGDETDSSNIPLASDKHYFVSVLPKSAGKYTLGGAPIQPGQDTVTVTLNKLPLPTAQITVFVFEDIHPINNAPDLPEEQGLAGFSLILEDAGGRYGISAGQQVQDVFGNPLGTTYDSLGNILTLGTGIIKTDQYGMAIIDNLAPGKYGIQAVPPAGEEWIQTTTIEGTRVIDAWVKANEPPYRQEFGTPEQHVFMGFVQPRHDTNILNGSHTISGRVVNLHLSRPPASTFNAGSPFEYTTPWVGLNNMVGGANQGLYAQRANADGSFTIPNVPSGQYQLVVWDDYLDIIINLRTVSVGDSNVALGDVPVFNWFTRLETHVFLDSNENGFWDDNEIGIPEQNVNIRFRDGTLYQSMPTDNSGAVPFDQIFPFFNWLVAEVDFARYKATGATITVDDGGPVAAGEVLTPQLSRTELGPVLTQAFQGFSGQTSRIKFGKTAYSSGENGGISGIVYYATTRAEDDPEYAAAEPWEPGIPNVTVRLWDVGSDGIPNTGDELLLNETQTDSWDDNLPTDCPIIPGDSLNNGQCYDGLRNWNQVRPGVFDGGYAFTSYFPGGMGSGSSETEGLPPGWYMVEVVPPPGYEIVKSQDRNVDFGEEYQPDTPSLVPPPCVGTQYKVPKKLSLFPEAAPLAGQKLKLCDRKLISLTNGKNAAVDFFLFTEVPIAGHAVGTVLDDLANEFDPNSANFGEKFAPPWVPVSAHDWTGREVSRVYTDQWGRYSFLAPSTYTANLPSPSGTSPNMLILCMNSAGPIPNPNNPAESIIDPHFNPRYREVCYTFNFMPGTTTYLDTPVIPSSAFAGSLGFPVDCELSDGTPKIHSVTSAQGGPYVTGSGTEIITIQAEGTITVPNPAYSGPDSTAPFTISRDYGFGNTEGSVTIGGNSLVITNWSASTITAEVSTGIATGQLMVTRGDNNQTTVVGVTVTVGGPAPRHVTAGGSIQTAINQASVGQLILVAPGQYDEMLIMWKPVRLQGWGAGSTLINAINKPTEKLQQWRKRVSNWVNNDRVDLLPSQLGTFVTEEGAGITVLAKQTGNRRFKANPNARIDGFTIMGATVGGGIFVNGYANHLEISNNRIVNNTGTFGGGIRIGHPNLTTATDYVDAHNDNIRIHHNHIAQNAGLNEVGGGISLCNGTDNYEVTRNFICGNFTTGSGGGIGHLGLNSDGHIAHNKIIFNQSFNQGITVSGGGIIISGNAPLAGQLTAGSGTVTIDGNLISGNLAGAGDGGGIRFESINGQDVQASPNDRGGWHYLNVFNNIIVNNITGLAGGGMSLQDAAAVRMINNTIAHNDSTATAGEAFAPDSPNLSTPQPAGIVSRVHSNALQQAFGASTFETFADPELFFNNIIWQNRSFYWELDDEGDFGLIPRINLGEPVVYADLGVLGTNGMLHPQSSILTDTTGYGTSNISADPLFINDYFNGSRSSVVPSNTAIQTAPAFDEGGNFIDVQFGPLTLTGDYHISPNSPAIDAVTWSVVTDFAELAVDFDEGPRPEAAHEVDIGADESGAVAPAVPPPGVKAIVPETITVILSKYVKKDQRVIVKATSSLTPESIPVITATANYDADDDITLGKLKYLQWKKIYRGQFKPIEIPPDSITLTSSNGTTVTVAVPYP